MGLLIKPSSIDCGVVWCGVVHVIRFPCIWIMHSTAVASRDAVVSVEKDHGLPGLALELSFIAGFFARILEKDLVRRRRIESVGPMVGVQSGDCLYSLPYPLCKQTVGSTLRFHPRLEGQIRGHRPALPANPGTAEIP